MRERIKKRENELKYAFWERFAQLYPSRYYFVAHVQDIRRGGYPDSALHGFGHVTWWEFKHATPNFTTHGLQEITCQRLAKHAYCRYVIFYEYCQRLETIVAHPANVRNRKGLITSIGSSEIVLPGHDFTRLAKFMHALHYPSLSPEPERTAREYHDQYRIASQETEAR